MIFLSFVFSWGAKVPTGAAAACGEELLNPGEVPDLCQLQ